MRADDGVPMSGMRASSPLLQMLDGLLSQDEDKILRALTDACRVLRGSNGEGCCQGPCPFSSGGDAVSAYRPLLEELVRASPAMAAEASSHDKSLPLHFAASLGDIELARTLLDYHPAASSTPNEKGKIPLHYAAREGRTEMVSFLLQRDPRTASILSDKDKLALHFAAGEGHFDIVQQLLTVYPAGASVESSKGKIPLHFAARWGFVEIAHQLLSVYPDGVRTLDWEGCLPLHDAAREGQFRMCRYLVERFPAALTVVNIRGEIPLFTAVRTGNVDLVVFLVQAWPAGAQYVLQQLSPEDNVSSWPEEILELLLRAAVRNFHNCFLLEGKVPPTICLQADLPLKYPSSDLMRALDRKRRYRPSDPEDALVIKTPPRRLVVDSVIALSGNFHWATLTEVATAASVSNSLVTVPTLNAAATASLSTKTATDDSITSSAAIRPRSAMPSHQEGDKKKRSSLDMTSGERKRMRTGMAQTWIELYSCKRRFLPLHAALESRASMVVLDLVAARFPHSLHELDDLGRFPLHWAAASTFEDSRVEFVLQHCMIAEAIGHRDVNDRLPLHIAIAHRANSLIITRLLDAFPTAGVTPCSSYDGCLMPLQLAIKSNCDLSTIYSLIRVDPSYAAVHRQEFI